MKIHEQMTCVKQSMFNDNNPMGAEIGPILGQNKNGANFGNH